jgi:hypothetical protein
LEFGFRGTLMTLCCVAFWAEMGQSGSCDLIRDSEPTMERHIAMPLQSAIYQS